jgi:prepilin-type N-terminal cleavage/methylation domain-containing protein
MKTLSASTRTALTLVELMVAMTISAIALGAVYSGAISMQRCFVASQDFADAKKEQTRLSDYLAMDLRRASAVTIGGGADVLLTITMQDYYGEDGKPRTPTITKYVHSYGDPAKPMVVRYRRTGQFVYRQVREEPPVQIATGIVDFKATPQDGGRIVHTSIMFAPKFNRTQSGGNAASQQATAVRSTTLVRNIQK